MCFFYVYIPYSTPIMLMTAHSKLVVDNDEQDYHEFDSLNDLYEDEEQDNHLEEVKEQNDESLGEEVFVMENEE